MLIEQRHQRSTMFFLQNEQRAVAQQQRGVTAVPTKPLRDRIDALLQKPDNEALTLPAAELKALIVRGASLFKEQDYFLTGKKAQLMLVLANCFCFHFHHLHLQGTGLNHLEGTRGH
jgi:hypothetical protein